jgi:hypothetical protein
MSDPITYNPAPSGGQPPVQYQPQGEPPQQESTAKKVGKNIVGRLLVYGIILVVVLVGGYLYKVFTNDTELAKVGDCVTEAVKAEDMKTIDCADAKAAYKVVAVVDGTAGQAQADDETNPCARFADAVTSLWMGEVDRGASQPSANDTGKILCLASTK